MQPGKGVKAVVKVKLKSVISPVVRRALGQAILVALGGGVYR